LDALPQNVRRSATGGELGVATVREYAPADREPVLAVFQSNVPEHFAASEDAFLRETMASPDGPLFVVVEAEKVVGFGGYEVSNLYNQGVLVWGMIRADRHKRGLGRLLLAHRLEHMAAAGNRPRWVVVDTTPHIAGFYERCGFEVVARWPGGYRAGFDRVDLRLELTDAVVAGLLQPRHAEPGAAADPAP
jgi:GNAT superfamily N-acetyltransferase